MDTLTINRSDLEHVFRNLKTVKNIKDAYEGDPDRITYEKYLSEFVGIYCAIVTLGLVTEWDEWQLNYDLEAMKGA